MSEKNILDTIINNLIQDRDISGFSDKWANWKSKLTLFTCMHCAQQHGKIFDISILEKNRRVNEHDRCQCEYVPMRTKTVGTATNMGYNGADAQLFYLNRLPNYYVSKDIAYAAGWKKKHKQLDDVLPGKMIGGDIYNNEDEKLPVTPNRVWYEADINYKGGKRNRERILYSNDGLIFATYDHYQTFYEITK